MIKDEWWGEDVVPRIPWRIIVREMEPVPEPYGIAYYRLERAEAICYPIPINVIIGGWRALVRWLRFPPWRSYEWRLRREYLRGLDQGRFDHYVEWSVNQRVRP